ncbi:MAG: tRNA (N(6)-L-threonylcarbamoyladenosine(37)-C(2))-methylthiotransferase [Candidatus Bathyarchaeia archaeon]
MLEASIQEDVLLKNRSGIGREDCRDDHKGKLKTIYFETYGCTSNKSDVEIMLALLAESGYCEVDDPEDATIIFINTCAVKKVTEDRMLERLKKLRNYGKPVIIAGCLPRIDMSSIEKTMPDYSGLIDSASICKVVEVADAIMSGSRREVRFSDKPVEKPALPRRRLNRFIEITPISEGCLGECTYCCTRFARGRLFSYSPMTIIERVKRAVYEGALEVQITAQDTACYNAEGYTLGGLLKEITEIGGEFKVRVGMMNPNYASNILDDLIRAYRSHKVYKFIHIPVQSGSDRILELMKRQYRVKDFISLVNRFRSEFPTISIATDFIVGFPGESEEDFEATMRLVEAIRPDIVNLSRYAPRPGTKASTMRQLNSKVVASRSRQLANIASKIVLEQNMRMIGAIEETHVTERSRRGNVFGRAHNYKKILIGRDRKLGGKVKVKVTSANLKYLCSEILYDLPAEAQVTS